tara:strand:- start:3063 stop:3401 length:339 start_codon:yes stop_codon:yes gene_type:complete
MSGVFAVSLMWTANADANSAISAPIQDPGSVTVVTEVQDVEPAKVPETAEETAFLDQVVCRAAGRAASRLRSRARVCDTRRAWRDMDEAAAAETRRVQNMGRYNRPGDPEGR